MKDVGTNWQLVGPDGKLKEYEAMAYERYKADIAKVCGPKKPFTGSLLSSDISQHTN